MYSRLVSKSGVYAIVLLTVIPIVLWLPNFDASSVTALFLSLGQVVALIGTVLFCINFILSARLSFLEPFFAGLNRIYIVHHLVGEIALILLLSHPLFIEASYLSISLRSVINLIWPPFAVPGVWFGVLALGLMVVLLYITLFMKIEYDFWKKTHKFLGVVLGLAALHVLLTGSLLNSTTYLRGYMYLVVIVAIASFSYRVLFGRILVQRRKCRIVLVSKLAQDVVQIEIEPIDGKSFLYRPGQFIFISPKAQRVPAESHPFSLVTERNTVPFAVAPKAVGGFTATLKLLKKGDKVLVEGPFGQFSYDFHSGKRQVWIAGGIGVTPFTSMARSLDAKSETIVDFFFSVKDEEEAVFNSVFEKIARMNPNFHYHLHNSTKQGRLTAEMIMKRVKEMKGISIFICGPLPMVKALREQFIGEGIKNARIYSEEFSLR